MRLAILLVLGLAGCAPRYTYPDGRGLAGQLEREVVALQQRVRQLQYEAATCAEGGTDAMYTDLVQILQGSEVQLQRHGSATLLTIPEGHLFSPGGLLVREESYKTLDLVSTALNIHREYTIVVEGHTDDAAVPAALRQKYPTSWELSFARARAVQQVLVYRYQVSEERFTVAGRSSFVPLASNDTPAGQTRNRRIVLWVYPPGAR